MFMLRACVIAIALALPACGAEMVGKCSNAGEMRCDGDVAQMCNSNGDWENFQSCGAIGQHCYNDPASCGGYTDISCCWE